MANPVSASSSPVLNSAISYLVGSSYVCMRLSLTCASMVPESPRWLITKDRRDEAYEILVKYHAEGDHDSLFVKAEMAQIETTIKLEMELGEQSWLDLFKTPGMRRRTLIACAMGVFTQFSGNTLIA